MKKRKLWVLMGGRSMEHSVSLVSGENIVRAVNPERYEIYPIVISEAGSWRFCKEALENPSSFKLDSWFQTSFVEEVFPKPGDLPPVDLAYLALHGGDGEDGHIQALLDLWGVPYTGSGMKASMLCMNKVLSKDLYLKCGIPTPKFWVLRPGTPAPLEEFSYPVFIKDTEGGSSVGIGKAASPEEARELVAKLFEKSKELIVEPLVEGREFSCGFMEGIPPLPATEIKLTQTDFFDFDAKYKGASEEITPAEVELSVMAQMQELAMKCHRALGLSVYSRTDMILDGNEQLWVLETNSLPGFTPQSLLPQQGAHIGLSYSDLIDVIVEQSLKK